MKGWHLTCPDHQNWSPSIRCSIISYPGHLCFGGSCTHLQRIQSVYSLYHQQTRMKKRHCVSRKTLFLWHSWKVQILRKIPGRIMNEYNRFNNLYSFLFILPIPTAHPKDWFPYQRLESPVFSTSLPIAGVGENTWIDIFPKDIIQKWNTNSLIQDLNLAYQIHFFMMIIIILWVHW